MKIKTLLLAIVLCTSYAASAQKNISPTDSLRVWGVVKNPTTFTIADLDTFAKTAIKDQIIYNHKGEVKDTLTGMSGIPIKALLHSIQYVYDNPKALNEFYFVFTASDGYKVVFSWNEIYNTEAGNSFFIVTEMKGKKLSALPQRIVFIASADIKTGRRYIKGLTTIEVKRIE